MLGTESSVYHFADIEVREQEFRVIRAGQVLQIEPKAFRLLLFLLHNPQKLITKEDLLNAVWGDAAVTENSLTRAIALLRHQLTDDPHQPRYIETVATVGYRFLPHVEVSDEAEAHEPRGSRNGANGERIGIAPLPSEAPDAAVSPSQACDDAVIAASRSPGSKHWGIRRSWALGAGLVCLLAVSPIWYLLRQPPRLLATEYTQITHDGHPKVLAGTDGVNLYLNRQLESQPIAQVATSGGEIAPIPVSLPKPSALDFSPDTSALLISSYEGTQTSLWSLHIPGNSLRHLVDIAGPRTGLSAVWSPDGGYVAYGPPSGDIRLIRSDGSEDRVLLPAQLDAVGQLVQDLVWSPDGRTIRFTRNQRFWEITSSGEKPHPLLPAWRPGSWQCCGHWTPNGEFFVFLSRDELFRTLPLFLGDKLWALDEKHSFLRKARADPIELTSGPVHWGTPIPSRDGKRIFARGVTQHGELVRFDTKSHQLRPYLGGISAEHVAFSPDARFMVYVTFPEGILWRANRDGSNAMQLTGPPFYPKNPHWSPDGTQILFFDTLPKGPTQQMYLIPSQGGTPQPILPAAKDHQGDPTWSPDGRKILFTTMSSEVRNSRFACQILDLASHNAIEVPGSEGVWSPRWSPDGRYIAGLKNGNDLVVFDSRTQRWSLLVKGDAGYPTWSRDGKFLYFDRVVGNPGVFRIRPTGGVAERIIDLQGFRFTGAYAHWMGLDPDDTPMLLRDAGTDDIFAFKLEQK
jgi:DNA-binding winged helix-turn-helix (wHTH) protein/Tol biopolymer transport system component